MMQFNNDEERRQFILNQAAWIRTAAGSIKALKPVLMAYDGKVYNKRLDEAIRALSDDKITYTSRISYERYYIGVYPDSSYSQEKTLLNSHAAKSGTDAEIFTDKKRIKAGTAISLLNDKYAALMREAYELEQAAANLNNTLYQIRTLKKQLNYIYETIPYELHEVYDIKYIY